MLPTHFITVWQHCLRGEVQYISPLGLLAQAFSTQVCSILPLLPSLYIILQTQCTRRGKSLRLGIDFRKIFFSEIVDTKIPLSQELRKIYLKCHLLERLYKVYVHFVLAKISLLNLHPKKANCMFKLLICSLTVAGENKTLL